MFGGGQGRANRAATALAPPLARAWEYDAGAGFGSASAAAAESLVFVATLQGEVRAVGIADGREAGGKDFGEAIFGTPLLFEGRMAVGLSGDDETLVCYNLRTGATDWAVEAGDIESSPLLAGGKIVASFLDGSVAAFDPARGVELWRYALPRTPGRPGIRSSPSSDGERVFTGTDGGDLVALSLADGGHLWTADAGGPVFAAAPADGGRVYVSTLMGALRAFDAATGAAIWTFEAGAPLYGAAAVAPEAVVVGSSAGDLVSLHPATGSLLWRTKIAGGIGSAPLVSGGFVYAGDLAGRIAAYDLADGTEVWTEDVGGRVRATPVVAEGRLIVLAEDRSVVCFTGAGR